MKLVREESHHSLAEKLLIFPIDIYLRPLQPTVSKCLDSPLLELQEYGTVVELDLELYHVQERRRPR